MRDSSRRAFLRGIGVTGLLGITQTVSASTADDRYIVDVGDSVTRSDRARIAGTDLDVVHDLEHVGYFVVEGDESDVAATGYDYDPDLELERNIDVDLSSETQSGSSPDGASVFDDVDISDQIDEFPTEYGWDIASLDLPDAHDINDGLKPDGDPVRIGIIDDGVYDHDDLDVDVNASVDLTGDGEDVLHPNEQHYHGTHVAGIASANGGTADSNPAPSSGCDCSTPSENPVENRQPDGSPTSKPDPAASDTATGRESSVSSSNSSLAVNVGELSSGCCASDGGEWVFDGLDTLYRETFGFRDGTNQHFDAENNGTVLSQFPSSVSPGSTATATLEMPVETDSGTQVTLEVERRVTLESSRPILDVEYEVTNTASSETVDDLRLSQYVDYDIDDILGDYAKYFYDSNTGCEYIFLEDTSTGKLAGFTAESTSVNHSLTQYSTGLDEFTSNDPQFDNDDREPDTGTDDVELTFEWSLGTLPAGESTTFRTSFVYNDSPQQFQQQICSQSPGGGSGAGRDGVAPQAEVVSMRYFSTAGAFFGDFAAAVDAAIDTDCDVINASLGFRFDLPESRSYLEDYVDDYVEELANVADSNGIVWVASAGNSANNANELVPGPAKADDVLAVSATGPTGIVQPDPVEDVLTPSNYTTFGEDYVDVAAPGGSWDPYGEFAFTDSNIRQYIAPDGVLSTYPPDTVSSSLSSDNPLPAYVMPDPSGSTNYGFLQGTSMAAPQVTGVAALLAAENPDWTPHEIRQVIKATAWDIAPETYYGHGYVDPVAALQVSDPENVRNDLDDPDSNNRDDRGRNEYNDGNPRDGDDNARGESRGDDDDSGSGRSR